MLRKTTLGAGALALFFTAGAAGAADIITYEPTPTPTPGPYSHKAAANWTGPYLGVTGGYNWGGGSIGHDGIAGGFYGGYNFQMDPNWVLGLEGDFTFTGKSGTAGSTTVKNPWNGTVRGRLGYAFDRYMVYGTGGVAFGGVEATTSGTKQTGHEVGWTAGAGIEALITQSVTARAEFRHTNLGAHAFGAPSGTLSYTSNDIMVGVGMRF